MERGSERTISISEFDQAKMAMRAEEGIAIDVLLDHGYKIPFFASGTVESHGPNRAVAEISVNQKKVTLDVRNPHGRVNWQNAESNSIEDDLTIVDEKGNAIRSRRLEFGKDKEMGGLYSINTSFSPDGKVMTKMIQKCETPVPYMQRQTYCSGSVLNGAGKEIATVHSAIFSSLTGDREIATHEFRVKDRFIGTVESFYAKTDGVHRIDVSLVNARVPRLVTEPEPGPYREAFRNLYNAGRDMARFFYDDITPNKRGPVVTGQMRELSP